MAFRHALLRTTVISGLAALAFAPAAMAQQASDVDELVVTGSRIKSNTYTSSSPIQVITGETQTLQGLVDTAEVLQRSSLASGSFQVNNQLTGFVTTGGPGRSRNPRSANQHEGGLQSTTLKQAENTRDEGQDRPQPGRSRGRQGRGVKPLIPR